MPKNRHSRKLTFLPRVNKVETASNRKAQMKSLSSRMIQLKEECKCFSTALPIVILKECNEGQDLLQSLPPFYIQPMSSYLSYLSTS